MLKIAAPEDRGITDQIFGGKAAGLSVLVRHGLRIPKSILIEACGDASQLDNEEFLRAFSRRLAALGENGRYSVAVRSSSTVEDGFSESKAGHFKTVIGSMSFTGVLDRMRSVITDLTTERSGAEMGVIVQQKIDADLSGVIFSSNPLTYSKSEMLLSYVSGMGETLVSGACPGQDMSIQIRDGHFSFEAPCAISPELLETLCQEVKRLEEQLHFPVDVEWAIKGTELFYLQCRPLTSITKIAPSLSRVSRDSLWAPRQLTAHDKVCLRLQAEKNKIAISDAYVYVHNSSRPDCAAPAAPDRSPACRGFSAVVIYPHKLSNKVVRSFVGDERDISAGTPGCGGYEIHSFPDYRSLTECLDAFADLISREYWVGAVIIQEIYDPLYTGILQKIRNGYLIEITRGHFLTKGVVPTSQYVLDGKGTVVSRRETEQNAWYKIIEGHVLYCRRGAGADARVTLKDSDLTRLIRYFSPLLTDQSSVIEFGVLSSGGAGIEPYLIDFARAGSAGSTVHIAASDISDGIISRGRIRGTVVRVTEPAAGSESLNMHLHDGRQQAQDPGAATIFLCRGPDISLLTLLENHRSDQIGFLFEDGSLLCHFAIILRERGIPAIKTGPCGPSEYPAGRICTIDAETPGLTGKERVFYE